MKQEKFLILSFSNKSSKINIKKYRSPNKTLTLNHLDQTRIIKSGILKLLE